MEREVCLNEWREEWMKWKGGADCWIEGKIEKEERRDGWSNGGRQTGKDRGMD